MSTLPHGVFLANASSVNETLLAIINGQIALKRVSTLDELRCALGDKTVDVVLSSWEFPSGNWKNVVSAVAEKDRDIPVIVVSTDFDDAKAWYQVFRGGGFDTVSPPFRANLIQWVLHQALESRAARKLRQEASA